MALFDLAECAPGMPLANFFIKEMGFLLVGENHSFLISSQWDKSR
jgi:hypothetical protein